MDADKQNWDVIAYDDTGRVAHRTTLEAKTQAEVDEWIKNHRKEEWETVTSRPIVVRQK